MIKMSLPATEWIVGRANNSKKRVQEGSILERKKWTFKHLKTCNMSSYFAAWVGNEFGTRPIYQVIQNGCPNNEFVLGLQTEGYGGATEGSGCMEYTPIPDGATFSTSLRPKLYHWAKNHGDDWEDCVIGDVTPNAHDKAMHTLGINERNGIDQARFDALQGVYDAPSFLWDLGTGKRSDFVALNMAISRRIFTLPTKGGYLPEEGKGVRSRMDVELPLGHCSDDAKEVWTLHCDSFMLEQLALDPSMLLVAMNAEVRGADNSAITLNFDGYKLGNLRIIEAPSSISSRNTVDIQKMKSAVKKAGLRRYAVVDGKMIWEGCKEFTLAENQWLSDPTSVKIYSRGFIVGNGALTEGFDSSRLKYTLASDGHHECAQSKLKVPYDVKKTRFTAENVDCSNNMADVDYGVITVDMLHTPLTVCNPVCDSKTSTVFPKPMLDGATEECSTTEPVCDPTAEPIK